MTPETLAVRGLNACRQLHKPTYVGLRALLESESDQDRVNWAVEVASRKAQHRMEPRYYIFKGLKEINEKGETEYRDFLVGSPTTLLLEAKVLQLMAREKVFAVPPNVYSNLWPKTNRSGRNFAYYARGYAQRNDEIRAYLQGHPNHVAVVSDIRKFYPSVKWDDIAPRLERRLEGVSSKPARAAIENCTSGLQLEHPKGIPIGPDVAHVLGTIALEDVDKELANAYGTSYFRYVDDIIVLCRKQDVETTQAKIKQLVKESRFEIHDGKDDVVDANTWVSECPEYGSHKIPNSFESLVHDICFLLAMRPKRVASLKTRFKDAGFSLPISRMVSLAKYGPFHAFLSGEAKRRGFVDVATLYFRSDDSFVEFAQKVRDSLWISLQQLGDMPDVGKGMQRRWFVQQARYRINRLLYLTSTADYTKLLASVPAGTEFEEYRILLNALATGDLDDLVRLPGRTVSSYCELLSEGQSAESQLILKAPKNRALAESATQLGIYFGWKPDGQTMSKMYEGSRTLLEIATGGVGDPSGITPLSYLDEMELLLRDHSVEQLGEMARTRQFEGESLGLEALGLGGGYGFS